MKDTSLAQAREIARLWSGNGTVKVTEDGGFNDSTTKSLIRRGWIEPTDVTGMYPNGATTYRVHKLTPAALKALGEFLLEGRR